MRFAITIALAVVMAVIGFGSVQVLNAQGRPAGMVDPCPYVACGYCPPTQECCTRVCGCVDRGTCEYCEIGECSC